MDARYRGTIQTKGGMSLILTANMSGCPAPTAAWYFNDQPVVPGAATTIESGTATQQSHRIPEEQKQVQRNDPNATKAVHSLKCRVSRFFQINMDANTGNKLCAVDL